MKKKFPRTNRVDSLNQPCWFVFLCLLSFAIVSCTGEKENASQESEPASSPPTQPVASSGKVELTVTPEIFEADAKAGDETVDVQFELTNQSTEAITVVKLDTTCRCLKVEVEDKVIAPGESTRLNAVFEIENLLGSSEKLIEVYTDKNERPQFLPVKVNVPSVYEIEPKNLTWKLNAKPEPKVIVYKTLRDKPIHVKSVKSSRPDLVTVSFKEIEKGKHYEILVTPSATNDHLLGFVTIETDLEISAHKNAMGFFTVSDFD